MFIHKLAIIVCETGYVVTDETDTEDKPFPIAGFGSGQLAEAIAYVRRAIEVETVYREEDVARFHAAQAAQPLGNVVAGPGFKAPPAVPEQPSHTVQASMNGASKTVVDLHDCGQSVLIDWAAETAHFSAHPVVPAPEPVA